MRIPVLSSAIVILCSTAMTMAGPLENPGFEDGWKGWSHPGNAKDGAAISEETYAGVQSAKITDAVGRFEQATDVYPNSRYELKAYVRGKGMLGVVVGDETVTVETEDQGDDWVLTEIGFGTGPITEVNIFGAYSDEDVRFDDFSLNAVAGPAVELEAADADAHQQQADIKGGTLAAPEGDCQGQDELTLIAAADDGTSRTNSPPELAIDGQLGPDSRWSSQFAGKELILDMGTAQTLKELHIAWFEGAKRIATFEAASSVDGDDYEAMIDKGQSMGTDGFERYDVDDRLARFIRIIGHGNSSNDWNSVVEVQALGCDSGTLNVAAGGQSQPASGEVGLFGLRTDALPSENFDLTDWKLTLPVDRDGDGDADEIEERELASGWSDPALFFTDPVTGGLVFRTPQKGAATTINSSYLRTELREMLRAGDESINTRNSDGTPNKNNWVLPTVSEETKAKAGGVGGVLRATLAVNQVTRLGPSDKVGRVIIGQIHGKDDEPLRLYYRKLPDNDYGSIYYAHEPVGQDDIFINIIGDRRDNAPNPDDGIALDEIFSYEIRVVDETVGDTQYPMLHVTIIRDDGREFSAEPLNLADSGFGTDKNFLYFKAGVYSQNSHESGQDNEADQATFYKIDNTH